MNVTILGGAGFIGTNLAIQLASDDKIKKIKLFDKKIEYFDSIKKLELDLLYFETPFAVADNYDLILHEADVVYHLLSTTSPSNSNQDISDEIISNVVVTTKILDACVRQNVKKLIFISSGGTVYGRENLCPIKEEGVTNPISSYGIQKLTIEKLLYLYNYLYQLDYRVIRLANPYGPYQRPDGRLGVVTTFAYKALKDEEITILGDGSVIRDFIYIDDAVRGIINIVNYMGEYKLFNLGRGIGTSINEVVKAIEDITGKKMKIRYVSARQVDIPVNFLDISRYENACGKLNPINLKEGINKTIFFLGKYYG